jgi:hypothetical protein
VEELALRLKVHQQRLPLLVLRIVKDHLQTALRCAACCCTPRRGQQRGRQCYQRCWRGLLCGHAHQVDVHWQWEAVAGGGAEVCEAGLGVCSLDGNCRAANNKDVDKVVVNLFV